MASCRGPGESMRRSLSVGLCLCIGLFASGCPKGQTDYNKGAKAETLQDFDAAMEFYQKALKTDPYNAGYKIKFNQARFDAGEQHVKQGLKQRERKSTRLNSSHPSS